MAIITLTTDFGEKDYYAGAIKGAIYSESEDLKIVDISHCIQPFNILEAAYIIQNAYKQQLRLRRLLSFLIHFGM